ncbi:MAG TPA: chemotaxis protein CheW [Acidobacteriota bacterium]|nr:chemotaxis protein CheW [Acidobacteriota bacterium]
MSESPNRVPTDDSKHQRAASRAPKTGKPGGKFLTFFLASEEYGLEILKVHEIIGMMPITRVPRTPHFIRGVINLRGKVIPVVDLRLKFAMDEKEETEETCIIVVQAQGVEMGIIVDKVSEVLDIAGQDIDDPPNFGPDVQTDYLLGIGKSGEKVRLLLDIDKVLSSQEVIDVRSVAVASEAASDQGN